MESFLIKQVDRELTVDIALGDDGISGTNGPLDADCAGRALGYVLDISKGDVVRNLLLQRKRSLRIVAGGPHDLRIDGQFAHTEQTLQAARNRADGLPEDGGSAGLFETLLGRRRLLRGDYRIGSRGLTGRQERNDLLKFERRIGMLG